MIIVLKNILYNLYKITGMDLINYIERMPFNEKNPNEKELKYLTLIPIIITNICLYILCKFSNEECYYIFPIFISQLMINKYTNIIIEMYKEVKKKRKQLFIRPAYNSISQLNYSLKSDYNKILENNSIDLLDISLIFKELFPFETIKKGNNSLNDCTK